MATRAFSVEDGNLNNIQSVTSARKRSFSDIDLLFSARPNGDVYKKTDAASVKQSVKNLLLTNSGEKPFSSFGGDLSDFLFELADDITKYEMRNQIIEAIQDYEPRVKIDEIYLNQDRANRMYVNIHFGVRGVREPQEIEVILQRVR